MPSPSTPSSPPPETSGVAARGPPLRRAASILLATVAAVALRLLPWHQVFTPDGVRFFPDTDPHYHVLRAERILAGAPGAPWFDPALDHPHGAEILWPPLFDQVIATTARMAAGPRPDRAQLERVAAFVPVALGALTVPLLALLAALLLGAEAAACAAWLLALLPAHVQYSLLGRADQHVAEVLLLCWVLSAFAWTLRDSTSPAGRRAGEAALGAGLAAAFWTWQGSALLLLLLLGLVAGWHLLASRSSADRVAPQRALASGAGLGGLLLAASIAWWGPSGSLASPAILGVTGLQVALTLGVSAASALLVALGWRWPRAGPAARLGQVGLAMLVPAVLALALWPALLVGVEHGLAALTSSTGWYAQILEFRPLLGLGPDPMASRLWFLYFSLGPSPLLMVAAVPALGRRWREQPGARVGVLTLALLGAGFALLTLFRARFILYLTVPAALLPAAYATSTRRTLPRWITFAAAGLAAAPMVLAAALQRPVTSSFVDEELVATLRWLRQQPAAPAGADGVLGRWIWGHAVQYYAAKPVVATPFGTDAGAGVMTDEAAFFLARDPAEVRALLARRQVGFLLLDDPLFAAHHDLPLAPPGTPPAVRATYGLAEGEILHPADGYRSLVVARLYLDDGVPRGESPALDGFRLLYESPDRPGTPWVSQGPFRIFQVVTGAVLQAAGASPGSRVTASVEVVTNQGRAFRWWSSARADGAGRVALRVPYATGPDGAVTAGPVRLEAPGALVEVSVDPGAVVAGRAIDVSLEAGHR